MLPTSMLTLVLTLILPFPPMRGRDSVAIVASREAPVVFAVAEIRAALKKVGRPGVETGAEAVGHDYGTVIVIAAGAEQAKRAAETLGVAPPKSDAPQSYAIRVKEREGQTVYVVLGADNVGAMYGGLDVAEAVRQGTLETLAKAAIDRAPHVARRGIKFNIPLDARTPSYSDAGDAAQQNVAVVWDMDFWREMLDEMARDRFNVLTLWNLHPFPSLVKVPEYPDVALADVKRTTVTFDATYSLTGTDMVRKETLANLETVKRMTIEEKVAFWRAVMQHATDRGIEVYLFTWNIFTYGAQGKYGITPAQDNATTIDYFRRSVRETVLTYPLLAGIGITAGENMHKRTDEFASEQWLWKTYGEGIRDAKAKEPGRSVRLIHRFHQADARDVLAAWKEYPGTFDFSFKYSVAHMYSSPKPPFARGTLEKLPPHLRTWLTVRNDDVYSYRWGDVDYARAYVRNLPGPEKLAGFYMGPDGYIWGREFISTEPETPRQLVIHKQWYSFMMWGRLSYDPNLPDDVFRRALAERFPKAPVDKLYEASARASRIIPLVTRAYWNDIDLKWFPEACVAHAGGQGFRIKGFHTVRDFMNGQPMPEGGIVSVTAYRDRMLAKQPPGGMTPPEVAAELKAHARATRELIAGIEPGADKELRLTLGDLAAMAHLGDYYAEKLSGAVELAFFDKSGNAERRAAAVRHLEAAVGHWKAYAAVATRQYRPQHLTRIGMRVDLNALGAEVEKDVEMARGWQVAR